MNILFADEAKMQQFGPELIEFMQQRINLAVELDNSGLEISFFEKVIDLDETGAKEEEPPIFTVDSTPSKGRPASDSVPRYNQSFSEALTNDGPTSPATPNGSGGRRALSCFNCDGDHNLRDCSEPRNQQKINANRKARTTKSERYHVDLSQKYGHLRPGQISSRLQKAMGLKTKDLPVHIFRMRKLGYPPGWLEEAKISHSGINLIGSDGTIVLESDDEDGEVDQVKDKYDPTRVIEYPGFNVDAPEDSYDDANLFDCPPMQEEHRKETFISNCLGVNVATAYKRRKMNSFPMNESDGQGSSVAADMDMSGDEEEDGEIKEAEEKEKSSGTGEMGPPDLPPTKDAQDGEVAEKDSSFAVNTTVNDSLVEFILQRDEQEEVCGEKKSEIEENGSTDNSGGNGVSCVPAGESTPPLPVTKPTLTSKQVMEGTPLLKSASPFDKLPDGDKWSVGVSEVINFENLPDSTGKYEQMKVLIKKVQTVVKQINNE